VPSSRAASSTAPRHAVESNMSSKDRGMVENPAVEELPDHLKADGRVV
jgi:hypothetical protein